MPKHQKKVVLKRNFITSSYKTIESYKKPYRNVFCNERFVFLIQK